jgi:hypothetical protein
MVEPWVVRGRSVGAGVGDGVGCFGGIVVGVMVVTEGMHRWGERMDHGDDACGNVFYMRVML